MSRRPRPLRSSFKPITPIPGDTPMLDVPAVEPDKVDPIEVDQAVRRIVLATIDAADDGEADRAAIDEACEPWTNKLRIRRALSSLVDDRTIEKFDRSVQGLHVTVYRRVSP